MARPELIALLQDARAHPDNLERRRVLADWLDDHGESDRAELVRLQCELAEVPEYEARHYDLLSREGELLNRHGDKWLGPLVKCTVAFHRGLLRLELTPDQLRSPELASLAGTETWAWVETLRFSNLSAEDREPLDASPLLDSIAGIDLEGVELSPEIAQVLGQCPRLAHLREVNLGHTTNGGQVIAAFVEAPARPGLTSINLTAAGVDLDALAASPLLAEVAHLILDHNYTTNEGLIALSRSKHASNLRTLGLAKAWLWPDGCRALAKSKHLGNLTRLDLSENDLSPAIVKTVITSNAWPKLRSLNLYWNQKLGTRGARVLAENPWKIPLRELNLGGVGIGDRGIAALAGAKHVRSLEVLDLFGNDIGPKGAAALADSSHFAGLVELNLNTNGIGPDGMAALAGSPHLSGLKKLSLDHCEIDAAGTRALATSRFLSGLVEVCLSSRGARGYVDLSALQGDDTLPKLRKLTLEVMTWNAETMALLLELPFVPHLAELHLGSWMTEEAVALLADCPHLRNLTVLRLPALALGDASARVLARSPYLERLTILDLSHNPISPEAAEALLSSPNLPRLRRLHLAGAQAEEFAFIRLRHRNRLFYQTFDYGDADEEADDEVADDDWE
jgi:uncharacterized protein (TIGR02996 family)